MYGAIKLLDANCNNDFCQYKINYIWSENVTRYDDHFSW